MHLLEFPQNNHVEAERTPSILWKSRGKPYILYFTPNFGNLQRYRPGSYSAFSAGTPQPLTANLATVVLPRNRNNAR